MASSGGAAARAQDTGEAWWRTGQRQARSGSGASPSQEACVLPSQSSRARGGDPGAAGGRACTQRGIRGTQSCPWRWGQRTENVPGVTPAKHTAVGDTFSGAALASPRRAQVGQTHGRPPRSMDHPSRAEGGPRTEKPRGRDRAVGKDNGPHRPGALQQTHHTQRDTRGSGREHPAYGVPVPGNHHTDTEF